MRFAVFEKLGRWEAGRVSDREKPIAVPKDWGMLRDEALGESLETLGLEQSGTAHKTYTTRERKYTGDGNRPGS